MRKEVSNDTRIENMDKHHSEQIDAETLENLRKVGQRTVEAHKLQNNGQVPIRLDKQTADQVVKIFADILERRKQENADRILATQHSLGDRLMTSGNKEPDLVKAQRDWMLHGPAVPESLSVYMTHTDRQWQDSFDQGKPTYATAEALVNQLVPNRVFSAEQSGYLMYNLLSKTDAMYLYNACKEGIQIYYQVEREKNHAYTSIK